MVSLAMVVVAVVELVCVGLLWVRTARAPRVLLLGVVGLGIAYDSAVFGLGALIGEGTVLHGLSVGRFVGHALLTPLLVLWAVDRVGASVRWRRAAVVLTVILVGWGLIGELAHLRLVPRRFADTLRYAGETPAVPIPALVVTVVLLAAGTILWRADGLRFPLLGIALLVVASGAAALCPPLGNVGEAIMLAALVGAELVLSGRNSSDSGKGPAQGEPSDSRNSSPTPPTAS
ncbi:hypothetical protein [Nocardia alba]|uniref:Uncharacterized protein n=1 Tax=Nocardia alba TaxID=225051 RepID=A0A4R1FWN0_9NOCA|nr:hypothetical protein [Nocardia alba]TCJ97098.1 hypothetical protein DFR71_3134 [Nocardia alba]